MLLAVRNGIALLNVSNGLRRIESGCSKRGINAAQGADQDRSRNGHNEQRRTEIKRYLRLSEVRKCNSTREYSCAPPDKASQRADRQHFDHQFLDYMSAPEPQSPHDPDLLRPLDYRAHH